jgi:hypothetical protein
MQAPSEGSSVQWKRSAIPWTIVGLRMLQLWDPHSLSAAFYSPVLSSLYMHCAGSRTAAVEGEGVGPFLACWSCSACFFFSFIFLWVFVYMYLCRPSEASTRCCAIPGGYPPQGWQSLPCAGEELDSNPGLLICSQVRYHWATSPPAQHAVVLLPDPCQVPPHVLMLRTQAVGIKSLQATERPANLAPVCFNCWQSTACLSVCLPICLSVRLSIYLATVLP